MVHEGSSELVVIPEAGERLRSARPALLLDYDLTTAKSYEIGEAFCDFIGEQHQGDFGVRYGAELVKRLITETKGQSLNVLGAAQDVLGETGIDVYGELWNFVAQCRHDGRRFLQQGMEELLDVAERAKAQIIIVSSARDPDWALAKMSISGLDKHPRFLLTDVELSKGDLWHDHTHFEDDEPIGVVLRADGESKRLYIDGQELPDGELVIPWGFHVDDKEPHIRRPHKRISQLRFIPHEKLDTQVQIPTPTQAQEVWGDHHDTVYFFRRFMHEVALAA